MTAEEREELKERIAETLERLISFKTVASEEEELRKVIDYVEESLGDLKDVIEIHRYEFNGKHSLVAVNEDTREPEVLLVAHLDVVDAPEDMFQPIREGDIVRGRGAIDMKGPAAVLIELFKEWGRKKELSVGLMLTTDEEVGSENGIKPLLFQENWSSKVAIIPDGGLNFSIVTRNKGAFHFEVRARGRTAHGSTPWLGENAIDKIISFYLDLKTFIHPQPTFDPEKWFNTINLGVFQGGKKVNIVPSFAKAHIDIRFVKPYTVEQIESIVQALALKWGVEYEVMSTAEVVEVPLENPYINTFIRVYKDVMGVEPTLEGEHGATDARFFAEKKIPIITIYPVGGDLHGDNEWVDLDSLVTLYDLFDAYLSRLARGELEVLPEEVKEEDLSNA